MKNRFLKITGITLFFGLILSCATDDIGEECYSPEQNIENAFNEFWQGCDCDASINENVFVEDSEGRNLMFTCSDGSWNVQEVEAEKPEIVEISEIIEKVAQNDSIYHNANISIEGSLTFILDNIYCHVEYPCSTDCNYEQINDFLIRTTQCGGSSYTIYDENNLGIALSIQLNDSESNTGVDILDLECESSILNDYEINVSGILKYRNVNNHTDQKEYRSAVLVIDEVTKDKLNTILICKDEENNVIEITNEELNEIGNKLAEWGNSNCKIISINDRPVIWEDSFADGCNIYFEYLMFNTINEIIEETLEYIDLHSQVRGRLRSAIRNSNCVVSDLVSEIQLIDSNTSEQTISDFLECLGEISFSNGL